MHINKYVNKNIKIKFIFKQSTNNCFILLFISKIVLKLTFLNRYFNLIK